MDASRKIPGSIHDEKLIIQFYRMCPVNWVHISLCTMSGGFSDTLGPWLLRKLHLKILLPMGGCNHGYSFAGSSVALSANPGQHHTSSR